MKWSIPICKAQGFQFSAGFFQSPIEEFRSSKKSVNCELFSLVPLTLRTPVCLAFHILGGHLQQGQLSMTASDWVCQRVGSMPALQLRWGTPEWVLLLFYCHYLNLNNGLPACQYSSNISVQLDWQFDRGGNHKMDYRWFTLNAVVFSHACCKHWCTPALMHREKAFFRRFKHHVTETLCRFHSVSIESKEMKITS